MANLRETSCYLIGAIGQKTERSAVVLISLWNFAAERRLVAPPNTTEIDRFSVEKKAPEKFLPGELEAIKLAAKNYQASPAVAGWDASHYLALVLLILDTRLSVAACFRLRCSDFDGMQDRLRPASKGAIRATFTARGAELKASDPLFPWPQTVESFVKRHFKRIFELAGLENASLRKLYNSATSPIGDMLQSIGGQQCRSGRTPKLAAPKLYVDPRIVKGVLKGEHDARDEYAYKRRGEGIPDEQIVEEVKGKFPKPYASVQAMRYATDRFGKLCDRTRFSGRKIGGNPKNYIDAPRYSKVVARLGTIGPVEDLITLLAAYAFVQKLKPSSVRNKTRYVRTLLRWHDRRFGKPFRPANFSVEIVNSFLHMLRDAKVPPGTLKETRSALLSLWRFAAAIGIAAEPDSTKIVRFRTPDYVPTAWSRPEVDKLLDACNRYSPKRRRTGNSWDGRHDSALVRLILDTGFDATTCFSLTASSFDDRGQLATPVGTATREALPTLSPETIAAVRAILPTDPDARVFPWPHTIRFYSMRLKRILNLASLENTSNDLFQKLRRTAVTWRVESLRHAELSIGGSKVPLSLEHARDEFFYVECCKRTVRKTSREMAVNQWPTLPPIKSDKGVWLRANAHRSRHPDLPPIPTIKPRKPISTKTRRPRKRGRKRRPR